MQEHNQTTHLNSKCQRPKCFFQFKLYQQLLQNNNFYNCSTWKKTSKINQKKQKAKYNQRKTIKLNPTTKFKNQTGVWLLGRVCHCSQPLEHRSSLLTPIGMLRASTIRFQPPPILMWRCGRFPNTVIQFHLFPHSSINTTEVVFFPNVKAQNDS